MLQNMNQWAKGWMAWILVGGLAVIFAMWGISDFLTPSGGKQVAARVNDETISMQELDLVYDRMLKQQQQFFASNRMMGWEIDEKALKKQALQSLIDEKLLVQAVTKSGFAISDEQLDEYILAFPEFHEEGRFSNARFQEIATQMSMTPVQLKKKFHEYLLVGQLRNGVMNSAFLPEPELLKLIALLEQRREVGYAVLPVNRFFDKTNVTQEQMQAYYDKHKTEFVAPDQVQLEYVILSVADLAKNIQVSDQDINEYYQSNQKEFSSDELRRASHILITLPEDASDAEVSKATKTLNDYAQQIKDDKADFNVLAKEHSQDVGSSDKDGDLGWFSATDDQEGPLRNAIFSLKKSGDLSEPVRSKYGMHLVELTALKPAVLKPLAEVKDSIAKNLLHEKQSEVFLQKSDELSALAYEHPDSLEPAAQGLNLAINKTDFITQQGTPDGITANPQVIRVAFSGEVLQDKQNSELIDLGNDSVMVLRVATYKPAAVKSFDELKEDIKTVLTQEQAAEKVKQQGIAMVAELTRGGNPKSLASIANVSWQEQTLSRHTQGVDPQVIRQVFSMKAPAKDNKSSAFTPVSQGFSLANGDYVVAKLTAIEPGKEDDKAQQQAYEDRLTELLSYTDYSLYTRGLLNHAKIEIELKD